MDSKRLKSYLAVLVIVAFLGILLSLLHVVIPTTNNDAVMLLLGAIIGIVRDVYSYYFGSSESSARKSEILNKQAADAAAGTPA